MSGFYDLKCKIRTNNLQSIDNQYSCGEIGIRTRDTILSYTRFPGVPLKPLEHLSRMGLQIYGEFS